MLTVAAVTLALGYLAICALLFTQQRKILFQPPPSTKAPVRRVPETGTVVVYLHGNAMTAGDTDDIAPHFPHGFVALEYPGYGGLEGEPTEESLYAACEAQLRALNVPSERLVLLGQSLGTGPAVELARRGWGSRLVLLTPFT